MKYDEKLDLRPFMSCQQVDQMSFWVDVVYGSRVQML